MKLLRRSAPPALERDRQSRPELAEWLRGLVQAGRIAA
jgi:hypothetical protein